MADLLGTSVPTVKRARAVLAAPDVSPARQALLEGAVTVNRAYQTVRPPADRLLPIVQSEPVQVRQRHQPTYGVTDWEALSPEEQRALELEENLHRKDLTPYERSKTMIRLSEAVRAQPTCTEIAQVTRPHPDHTRGGGPSTGVGGNPYQVGTGYPRPAGGGGLLPGRGRTHRRAGDDHPSRRRSRRWPGRRVYEVRTARSRRGRPRRGHTPAQVRTPDGARSSPPRTPGVGRDAGSGGGHRVLADSRRFLWPLSEVVAVGR
jgi:hypothetical protein